MFELIKNGIYTGVGIGLMAKDKVEKLAVQLADEAKLSKDEGEKFVREFLKQSEENAKELEKTISEKVEKTIDKMNICPCKYVKNLEKRVEELEKKLAGSEAESEN